MKDMVAKWSIYSNAHLFDICTAFKRTQFAKSACALNPSYVFVRLAYDEAT